MAPANSDTLFETVETAETYVGNAVNLLLRHKPPSEVVRVLHAIVDMQVGTRIPMRDPRQQELALEPRVG